MYSPPQFIGIRNRREVLPERLPSITFQQIPRESEKADARWAA